MKKLFFGTLYSSICLLAPVAAQATDQWASKLIGFSSQYDTPNWSANQALKAPNTKTYGDSISAWAPQNSDGGKEFITLGFTTPVYATGVTIRETYGYGFVTDVDFIDTNGITHAVWSGIDTSVPGKINNFLVSVPRTTYLVKGVKIHINTALHGSWEEIDAVQLHVLATLSGTIEPHFEHTATLKCANITTGQSITKIIKGNGETAPVTRWDCETAGLKFKSGDTVSFQVSGVIAE